MSYLGADEESPSYLRADEKSSFDPSSYTFIDFIDLFNDIVFIQATDHVIKILCHVTNNCGWHKHSWFHWYQLIQANAIHITDLRKNGPIHILDHPKCWPIHILPFDFLYPFFAGYYTNITVNSYNTKRLSSLKKSLSEKYVHIPGCQKNGAFHIGIQKNRAIHILFVEERGPIIYLAALKKAALKKGAIQHAHPYYAIYRKSPPPHIAIWWSI